MSAPPPASKKRSATPTRDLTRQKSRSNPREPPSEPTDPDSSSLTFESSSIFNLRLTTRLRDCLVAEYYSVEVAHVENFFNICEAEVVPVHHERVDEAPSWQIDSFEKLTKLCDLDRPDWENRFKLHSDRNSILSDHVPVSFIGKPLQYEHSMKSRVSGVAECPRFNVLWLSPTVFISPLVLEVNWVVASDYCVRLLLSRDAKISRDANFQVYSISTFVEGAQQQDQSPLPFAFLRPMIKKLPVDFFSSICLEWDGRERDISSSICLEFLTIFPSSSTEKQSFHQRRDRTRCTFESPLNKQQSCAILSSPLLADNDLCLDRTDSSFGFGKNSTHTIPAWNAALRESRTLRHVDLPSELTDAVWDKNDVPFTTNSCIESVTMSLQGCHRGLTFFLDGIATNDGIKCVNIWHSTWSQVDLPAISYLLSKVLPGHPSLKKVFLAVKGEAPDLDRFLPFFTEWRAAAKRINLVHFSIIHQNWSVPVLPVLPSPLFQKWWDKNMVPTLAMNWYKNEQQKSKMSHQMVSSDSIQVPSNLSLQVRGVNRGNVYRMVTEMVAISDPATANAGLLFQMLRHSICRSGKSEQVICVCDERGPVESKFAAARDSCVIV
jgi:hypothetical protein